MTSADVNVILKQDPQRYDICTPENTTQKTQGCTTTTVHMDVLAEQRTENTFIVGKHYSCVFAKTMSYYSSINRCTFTTKQMKILVLFCT